MASENYLFLAIITGICSVVSVGILIFAGLSHRRKKSEITRALLTMYMFDTLAIVGGFIASVVDLFALRAAASFVGMTPTLLMLSGLYYYFIFARRVFYGEYKRGALDQFIKFFTIAVTCIQLLAILLQLYANVSFLMGLSVDVGITTATAAIPALVGLILVVYALLIGVPMLVGALRVRKRIPKDDPHQMNFLYIAIMSLAFILLMGAFVMDSAILQSDPAAFPTLPFLAAWPIILVWLYVSYRGFFVEKTEK